jgi:hypothetical protein
MAFTWFTVLAALSVIVILGMAVLMFLATGKGSGRQRRR